MPWCRSSIRGSGQPRRKFSLDEIRVLLAALGDPHRRFPSVLIAGTNGKGSTAATLASILTASGVRDRALHLAAPGAGERAHSHRTARRLRDEDFAGLYFRVHDAAQKLVLEAACRSFPVSLRF